MGPGEASQGFPGRPREGFPGAPGSIQGLKQSRICLSGQSSATFKTILTGSLKGTLRNGLGGLPPPRSPRLILRGSRLPQTTRFGVASRHLAWLAGGRGVGGGAAAVAAGHGHPLATKQENSQQQKPDHTKLGVQAQVWPGEGTPSKKKTVSSRARAWAAFVSSIWSAAVQST